MNQETSCANPLVCHTCPICGGPNQCQPARTGSFDGAPCWCTSITFSPVVLNRIPPAQRGKACICQKCAEQSNEETPHD